jgi:tetratricopeptide (TPR) repeat protein
MKIVHLFAIILLASTLTATAQSKLVDSLTREAETRGNDTGKVNALRMLTGLVRTSNPARAIAYGIALGRKLNFDRGLAGCYLNLSATYISASKLDSALSYIDTAIGFAQKLADPNRLALAYLNRADIYMHLNNLNQSLKNCDTALKYADQANNDDRRARIYQTIGSVYYTQEKYTESMINPSHSSKKPFALQTA